MFQLMSEIFGLSLSKERLNRYHVHPPKIGYKTKNRNTTPVMTEINPSLSLDIRISETRAALSSRETGSVPLISTNGSRKRIIASHDEESNYLIYNWSLEHVNNPLPCKIRIRLIVHYKDSLEREYVDDEIVPANFNGARKWVPVSSSLKHKDIREVCGKEKIFSKVKMAIIQAETNEKGKIQTIREEPDYRIDSDGVMEYVYDPDHVTFYDKPDAIMFNAGSYIPHKIDISRFYLYKLTSGIEKKPDFSMYKTKGDPGKVIIRKDALAFISRLYEESYLDSMKYCDPKRTVVEVDIDEEADIEQVKKYLEENGLEKETVSIVFSAQYYSVSNLDASYCLDFPHFN